MKAKPSKVAGPTTTETIQMVTFAKMSKAEHAAAEKIARRYIALVRSIRDIPIRDIPSPMDVVMDLSAVHAHTPLRLEELAAADDFDLVHDVGGIYRHLDRETGELGGCFLPRFSRGDLEHGDWRDGE
jgi:hypothetical protein